MYKLVLAILNRVLILHKYFSYIVAYIKNISTGNCGTVRILKTDYARTDIKNKPISVDVT